MKKILIIGNTCVDVIITVDHLPTTAEDLQPTGQTFSLGGCPFNTANIIRQSGVPFLFLTPVGTGLYGEYVAAQLTKRGFPLPVRAKEENGCCYCLVEAGGERTFLSCHGVEYTFREEWTRGLELSDIGMIYVCGLEVEESTGDNLVRFLEAHRKPELFFAPGPRVMQIEKQRLSRLFALHPVLHINEQESREISGSSDLEAAARRIREITGNTVIITLGEKGACFLERDAGELRFLPGIPAKPIDTIGAGDSHIGQIMASRAMGLSWEESVRSANRVSSLVVSVRGASLTDEQYRSLFPAR